MEQAPIGERDPHETKRLERSLRKIERIIDDLNDEINKLELILSVDDPYFGYRDTPEILEMLHRYEVLERERHEAIERRIRITKNYVGV